MCDNRPALGQLKMATVECRATKTANSYKYNIQVFPDFSFIFCRACSGAIWFSSSRREPVFNEPKVEQNRISIGLSGSKHAKLQILGTHTVGVATASSEIGALQHCSREVFTGSGAGCDDNIAED